MLYRIRNGLVAVAIPASTYLQPTVVYIRAFETRYGQIQCNTRCTAKLSFAVQSDCGIRCQLMSASCRRPPDSFKATLSTIQLMYVTVDRPVVFLIAPLHCFYLLQFSFLLFTALLFLLLPRNTPGPTPRRVLLDHRVGTFSGRRQRRRLFTKNVSMLWPTVFNVHDQCVTLTEKKFCISVVRASTGT